MKIQELFKESNKALLNIYFTAGFPQLNSLTEILESLETSGVDLVEIGIPYSDPISDGAVIQNSNSIALNNGITLELIFKQLKTTQTKIPKIMMGYFNSILQFGMERFCIECVNTNISGVILPDLTLDIWLEEYKAIFDKYGLSLIFLITPETSEERIRFIDKYSSSFIYAVSSSGTTGGEKGIKGAEAYLRRIQKMKLQHPVLVGFNISKPEDYLFACKYTRGGIIGSAFINHIESSTDLKLDIQKFITFITNKPQS